ncbi:MAG: protein kinase domain-containing protein, partial [Gemmataceae bacterium]
MKPAIGSETGAGKPLLNQARLEEVVLAWLEACRAGWAPERSRFLAAYPDLRAELSEFVEGQAAVSGAGAELPRESPGGVPLEELGTLGDFRLIREVGRGGMGVVYEAEQITLRRRVALKVLPFAAALDSRQLERFRNEALAAANLRHDHIVPVFAVGMERGVHFYAMQFIEGQSLATLVDTLGDRKAGQAGQSESADSRSGSGVVAAARGPAATTAPAHHAVSATPVTGVTMKPGSATALP